MSPVAVALRAAHLDEILALRHAVLRPGRPLDSARFDGDLAPDTVHLAALLADPPTVVACVTLMRRPWHDQPAWQLRGMATRPDHTRRGVGGALLRFAEETAGARGPSLLWCNARLVAVPFYQRGGWAIASAVFDIAGIGPHHAMLRRV